MEYSKNSSQREVNSDTCLSQETRKISINLTLTPKKLEKVKPRVRSKEIIKIKLEIEAQKTIEKINAVKSWKR